MELTANNFRRRLVEIAARAVLAALILTVLFVAHGTSMALNGAIVASDDLLHLLSSPIIR